jgi:hypothetical protein
MMEFSKYAKIKDHYCLCYFGACSEHLLQLRLLKPVVEAHFPGLKLHFGCRDDRAHILEGCEGVLKISELKVRRYDFAHIKEVRFNGTTHPVEDFLKECGITQFVVRWDVEESHTAKCVIITHAEYPTKSLERHQVDSLKRLAKEQGFEPQVDVDTTGAGLVMGVESYGLFDAAAKGIRTRLLPTGLGTRLYKGMFPKGEVMSL